MTDFLLVDIVELTALNLHVRSFYLFPPQSTNCHLRNNSSVNKEHPSIAGHCRRQKNQIICGKGNSAILFIWPGGCTTLPLPLQYKLAMPHDQFIFSSSWLPSARLELWTLDGYTSYSSGYRRSARNLCI